MSKSVSIRLGASAVGQNLAEYLAHAGYLVHADCGGKGKCGKCRVRLVQGHLYGDAACTRFATPDADGCVLSCRTWICEGAVIELPEQKGNGLVAFAKKATDMGKGTPDGTLGFALDVGTTTLACALVDVRDGSVLGTASALNPQASFGADVISRIEAVMQRPEALGQMQSALLDRVREMMTELAPGKRIARMTVAGNPTMLHIFCGVSPIGMGTYPFTPVFTETRTLDGAALGLPAETVTCLPGISAFVGGDLTAGLLHVDLCACAQPALLIDIGTNGESVLFTGTDNGGKLYAASAAAGPAMEGAGISTGMGGVTGAVCAVRIQSGLPVCTTVGDVPARGICGSGLIDLVSALYQSDLLDETGAFEIGDHFAYATTEDGTPLSLTQADIRAFQLSKSAIRASVDALVKHASLSPADIAQVYLAGGLGYYMNVSSAVAIGLLPRAFRDRTQSVGNASLGGCVRALADPAGLDALGADAARTVTLELSTDAVWNQSFMENMLFPEKDEI